MPHAELPAVRSHRARPAVIVHSEFESVYHFVERGVVNPVLAVRSERVLDDAQPVAAERHRVLDLHEQFCGRLVVAGAALIRDELVARPRAIEPEPHGGRGRNHVCAVDAQRLNRAVAVAVALQDLQKFALPEKSAVIVPHRFGRGEHLRAVLFIQFPLRPQRDAGEPIEAEVLDELVGELGQLFEVHVPACVLGYPLEDQSFGPLVDGHVAERAH